MGLFKSIQEKFKPKPSPEFGPFALRAEDDGTFNLYIKTQGVDGSGDEVKLFRVRVEEVKDGSQG